MPDVKTVELTGTETAVTFSQGHPYYWVQNFSDSDMYMSVSPKIVPNADGVIRIPANSGRSTGDVGQTNTLYILGSGKVEITAQYNAVCPYFKYTAKGGEQNDDRGYKVVTELPEIGSSKYIYLVPKSSLLSDNIYNEYLWVEEKEEKWELVGDTEIDLTDYVKKDEIIDVVRNPEKRKMAVTAVNGWEFAISTWPHDKDVGINMTIPYLTQNCNYGHDTISTEISGATYDKAGLLLPDDKKKLDKLQPDTKCLKVTDIGDLNGKTIGELKSLIIDWWDNLSSESFGLLAFVGNVSEDLWNSDNNIIVSSTRYQITPIGGYAMDSARGKFVVSTYINDDIFVFNITANGVSSLKKISLDTDAKGLVIENLGGFNNKTVGELKSAIKNTIVYPFDRFRAFRFNADKSFLDNWDNDMFVIKAGQQWQIIPIAVYDNNLHAKYLMSSYYYADIYYFTIINGNFSDLAIIYSTINPPADATASSSGFISASDKEKLDSITPEMIEKLKNL